MRQLLMFGAIVVPLLLLTQPGRAEAPVGRYEVSEDTVLDTKTGLTWRRAVLPKTFSFSAAATQCASLGEGWRVPTIKELMSIIDVRQHRPAIDPEVFPETPNALFWTSSVYARGTTSALTVNFTSGLTGTDIQGKSNHVRCVRKDS